MKKLRERLSNKKGFTLVELIVVIVIILILAAVLIPNVMRYISSARESAFQSEASGYMTEITGYEAEHFAKYSKDLPITPTCFGNNEDAKPGDPKTGDNAVYALTAYDEKLANGVTVAQAEEHTGYSVKPTSKSISVTVNKGAVVGFSYADDTYYVNWKQDTGWENVQKITTD